jgi:hypothetical protein
LTSSQEALSEILPDLQKQVAVAQTGENRFKKDLIVRKGTDFAPRGRHAVMVIGSEQFSRGGYFSIRAGPI